MKLSLNKVIISASVVLLSFIICFIAVRNLPYFRVNEVSLEFSNNITSLPQEIIEFSNSIKGKNIFSIKIQRLKSKYLSFPFVTNVDIKKYYPSKLEVRFTFQDMKIRIKTSESADSHLYLSDGKKLYECSREMFEKYQSLSVVFLSESYCELLLKTGLDKGFCEMVVLTSSLKPNNLISNIKYDNNNLSDFGRLNLSIGTLNSVVRVLEPVQPQRLQEALGLVRSSSEYDLYAGTMVRRNQEEGFGSR